MLIIIVSNLTSLGGLAIALEWSWWPLLTYWSRRHALRQAYQWYWRCLDMLLFILAVFEIGGR